MLINVFLAITGIHFITRVSRYRVVGSIRRYSQSPHSAQREKHIIINNLYSISYENRSKFANVRT